ncbi:MAG TPA: murein hydrolase regulator LrgA [Spongiibacteraceae bacterium]|nr:murein hydrolase regulator LrgA [Spongiibacteraceae bacterium]HCS28758.1 murein hydrolase regulator LrgA [Spongiibacteraceae bacterium]|tara:strand:+ start:2181 stop:2525 length:345 start_codon:yes stop_codon:yes gene_type:complete
MKLSGLLILLCFHLAGEMVVTLSGLPIPGAVVGLLLLFTALLIRGGATRSLEQTGGTMIGLLPLLLIVPSAGVFFLGEHFSGQWPAFAGAIVAGTLLTLLFSALLMKFLAGGKQ